MKLEELRKIMIEEKYLKKWAKGTWYWNSDGSVDIIGNVNVKNYTKIKLPFKFGKITGVFDCCKNRLETLENCPDEVGTLFDCSENCLCGEESLQGSPKKVGSNYIIYGNFPFLKKDIRNVCKVKGFVWV